MYHGNWKKVLAGAFLAPSIERNAFHRNVGAVVFSKFLLHFLFFSPLEHFFPLYTTLGIHFPSRCSLLVFFLLPLLFLFLSDLFISFDIF
jgi:hypothetical protein